MKTTDMVKYISILGLILTLILDLLKRGGDGISVIVVLISLFLFIAAIVKARVFQKN